MNLSATPLKAACTTILIVLSLMAPSIAAAEDYSFESPLYKAVLSDDGRLLSLRISGVETIRPQPEWLGEPTLKEVAPGRYAGTAGSRSITWLLSPESLTVHIQDTEQKGAARYHLPLSDAMAFTVFPKNGGETQRLPAEKHLNHTTGARVISESGPGFETSGRTTMPPSQESDGKAAMYFYYTGDGFTNSEAITLTPFLQPPPADLLAFDFSAFPKDFQYRDVSSLDFPVVLNNYASRPVDAAVQVRLEKFMSGGQDGEVIEEKAQNIAIAAAAKTPAHFTLQKPAPGPYEFVASLSLDGQLAKEIRGSLMVEMDQWTLPDREPEDFDAFWKRTLAEMRKRPLEPEYSEPTNHRGVPAGYRIVSFNGIDDTRVRGFILFPKNPSGKKLPAQLGLPGGGYGTGPLETSGLSRGFINLVISAHDLPFGGESGRHHPKEMWFESPYQERGASSRETFYYRQIYANAVRAVDFLKSLPQVDASRIAVSGGSQGGAVTLAVAGLAGEDIALAMSGCPGRSRWDLLNGKWRGVGYFADADIPKGHTRESLFEEVLAYFDTSYHAKRIRCPLYMVTPMRDEIDPWPLQYWAWRQAPDSLDKRIYFIPWARHNSTTEASRKIGNAYIDKYLLAPEE